MESSLPAQRTVSLTWGRAWLWVAWLWQELRETANPTIMHTEELTPAQLQKQASFESFEYYRSYSTIYMEHLRSRHRAKSAAYSPTPADSVHVSSGPSSCFPNAVVETYSESSDLLQGCVPRLSGSMRMALPHVDADARHVAMRWLLHVFIAICVGIVVAAVSYAVEFIETYRMHILQRVLHAPSLRVLGFASGFLFWLSSATALAAVAAGVVVFYEPAAAGGGISDVMAYLNGIHLRGAMNVRVFVAKAISCVCAVAAGLPVGLEAPLIHLGAITGAGVTQGRSRSLGFQTSLFRAFRNNKDRRDFITAGAACGVSAAFGAPIGGLLFVMEEVCSFWERGVSGHIFLATMVCFTVTSVIDSVVEDHRLLGWVSNAASVLFEVNLTIPLNLVSVLPSIALGATLGALAALFTKANLVLLKWRRRVLGPHPLRRFLEPVFIAAVHSGLMYCLSLATGCRPLREQFDLNGTAIHVWGTEAQARLFNDTCPEDNAYSPFASLNMVTGKSTMRHLFTRQTVGEYPAAYLLLSVGLYFVFTCWLNGAAVSGGLVVPSLVVGALFGRLFGLLLWTAGAAGVDDVERGYRAADAWMDPGIFALIGAGAFLAGTSRMTMSICVVMVELSSELRYLLPVMVAIVVSKTVADFLCEPLYHQMMQLDCVPYLPSYLLLPELEQLTAADVMEPRVVVLHQRERTEVVLQALRGSAHHAFPVVQTCEEGCAASAETDYRCRHKFIGLVTREDLQMYLTLPSFAVTQAAPHSLDWDAWLAHKASLFLSRANDHSGGRSGVPSGGPPIAVGRDTGDSVHPCDREAPPVAVLVGAEAMRLPPVVDFASIVNRSPWVIPPFFNLKMAYHLFRTMGLRHMVVVDGDLVCGMITRKDLLVGSLRRRMKELHGRLGTESRQPLPSPPTPLSAAARPDQSAVHATGLEDLLVLPNPE